MTPALETAHTTSTRPHSRIKTYDFPESSPHVSPTFPQCLATLSWLQSCGQWVLQWQAFDVPFGLHGDIILLIMWLFCVAVRPLIKVSNQLVAAPVGSNVDIGCDVEASPKAMNSWFRESGKVTYRTSSSKGTANLCPLFVSTDSYSRIRLWPWQRGMSTSYLRAERHRDVFETL